MTLTYFRQPPRILAHHRNHDQAGPYPPPLERLFPRALTDAAIAEIHQWPGYAPTPLRSLDRLAGALGIGSLLYKDESARFGLGSFKALGGAYAVLRLLSETLGISMADLRAGRGADQTASITVTTATDGNHGRSVAWGARQAGCRCRIYVHAHASEGRVKAITELGAEVVRVDGDYDDSVRVCARDSVARGWHVVSDTSYEGYTDIPRNVMAGYTTMAAEVADQNGGPLTHAFIQAGVGGLAAALAARFWMQSGEGRPRFVIVESEHAACLLKTARRGVPAAVKVRHETIMAGLSCGEASVVAWEILRRASSGFVTISDSGVAPTLRMLASGETGGGAIETGECSAAGVMAVIAACCDGEVRDAMRLEPTSRVLVIGSEGVTDPVVYERLIAGG